MSRLSPDDSSVNFESETCDHRSDALPDTEDTGRLVGEATINFDVIDEDDAESRRSHSNSRSQRSSASLHGAPPQEVVVSSSPLKQVRTKPIVRDGSQPQEAPFARSDALKTLSMSPRPIKPSPPRVKPPQKPLSVSHPQPPLSLDPTVDRPLMGACAGSSSEDQVSYHEDDEDDGANVTLSPTEPSLHYQTLDDDLQEPDGGTAVDETVEHVNESSEQNVPEETADPASPSYFSNEACGPGKAPVDFHESEDAAAAPSGSIVFEAATVDSAVFDGTTTSSRRSGHGGSTKVHLAEHPQEWVLTTAGSPPHHALYQPSRLHERQEEHFSKQFPLWTRPKGSSAVRSTSSTDAAPVDGDVLLGVPVVELRAKAKEFSDKLRHDHRATLLHRELTGSSGQNDSMVFEMVAENLASDNKQPLVGTPPRGASTSQRTSTSVERSLSKQQSAERREGHVLVHQWLHTVNPHEADGGEVKLSPQSSASNSPRAKPILSQERELDPEAVANDTHRRTSQSRRGASSAKGQSEGPPSPALVPAATQTVSIEPAPAPRIVAVAQVPSPAELEAKRRKLFLLYGHRKGNEFFQRFLQDNGLASAEQSTHPSGPVPAPASRRATPTRRVSTPRSTRCNTPSAAPQASSRRSSVTQQPIANESGDANWVPPTPKDIPLSPRNASTWERLYRTQIYHPSHSPSRGSRVPSSHDRCPSRTSERSAGKGSSRHRSPVVNDAVFDKLYRVGLDEKSKREKIYAEGVQRKMEKEMTESLDTVILARILRSSFGHQAMSKPELEAKISKERAKYLDELHKRSTIEHDESAMLGGHTNDDAKQMPPRRSVSSNSRASGMLTNPPMLELSVEQKMSPDAIDELSHRLYRSGKRKFEDEEKAKERRELAGCTFTPAINHDASHYVVRHGTPRSRTPVAQQPPSNSKHPAATPRARSSSADRCQALYTYAKREREDHKELRERIAKDKKLQILKSKLASDHHFKRRVELDPALADRFMASLRL